MWLMANIIRNEMNEMKLRACSIDFIPESENTQKSVKSFVKSPTLPS